MLESIVGPWETNPTLPFMGWRAMFRHNVNACAQGREHPRLIPLWPTLGDWARLGHNTRLVVREWPTRDEYALGVLYHSTEVVTYRQSPQGFALSLRFGGWDTPTTRARMNAYLPEGWGVYGKRGHPVLETAFDDYELSNRMSADWAFRDWFALPYGTAHPEAGERIKWGAKA